MSHSARTRESGAEVSKGDGAHEREPTSEGRAIEGRQQQEPGSRRRLVLQIRVKERESSTDARRPSISVSVEAILRSIRCSVFPIKSLTGSRQLIGGRTS